MFTCNGHTRTYMDVHPYMGTVSIYGNTSKVVLPYVDMSPYMVTQLVDVFPYMDMLPYHVW